MNLKTERERERGWEEGEGESGREREEESGDISCLSCSLCRSVKLVQLW